MSKPNTIQRFTHNHPLTEVNVAGTYTCNGCKLHGHGKTYRCNDCDYDLHEYCATCPPTLIHTWHAPDHELTLFTGPAHMTERLCYFCRFYIQGMFYKCKHCSFESHPLCTHGLMHVSSPAEPVTQSRSLHDHAAQPSSPCHNGQGNSYVYSQMSPPYPHGGGHHPHQHQGMNHGSPKPDRDSSGSSTAKQGSAMGGVVKTVAGISVSIAAHWAFGTVAENEQ
ncbi:Cysteine/Histidine-rich C1 domain family protein [Hirschfeldia incana]|nr:Cysteine/Histidine-rich C1 domain family protein [Hirschfeldia incana]